MTTEHRRHRSTTIDERDERHGMRLKRPGTANRESAPVESPDRPGSGLPSPGAGMAHSNARHRRT